MAYQINKNFLYRCKNSRCFKSVFNDQDLLNEPYTNRNEYFDHFWRQYEDYKSEFKQEHNKEINNTYNGQAFSIIIVYLLTREGIHIHSMDEEIGVPFVKPDIVVKKHDGRFFFLSLKTSLRERWKQADWEAIKFKKVYQNSYCCLLSNNFSEVRNVKKHLSWLDLDAIFNTSRTDLDNLFYNLKQ